MWSYQHASFTVYQVAALSDNYIYLIAPSNSKQLIVIDPAEAAVVRKAAQEIGRKPTHIFNTHHHADHTGANLELKRDFNVVVIGPTYDQARIPGIDIAVSEETPPDIEITHSSCKVMFLPGHTSGHIAFVIDDALFCGDVLFGAGCGRIFEGTPDQMWKSMQRLAALADHTKVYCAHEYTVANLAFAQHIDAENKLLTARIRTDHEKRNRGEPTIPTKILKEKETNPFLWPLKTSFCTSYAASRQINSDPLTVFTHLRREKDVW
ncbi:MAG: hydroxyacylglutathione hydrolase [Mariprofundaceae bacterium]